MNLSCMHILYLVIFMKRAIKVFDIILFFVCVVVFSFVIYGTYALPNEMITYNDNKESFGIFSYNQKAITSFVSSQTSKPKVDTIKVFGIVPVKDVDVTNKPTQQVYVSGEAFGIKIYTDGVIVVATQKIDTANGEQNPSKDAGLEVGDVIVSINNIDVFTSDDVQAVLNDNNGLDYKIKVKRGERYKEFTLSPVFSPKEGCYKAGLWVRDSSAGIGTITFYNKEANTFAALGHQINDVDTNEIIPILKGNAVKARITGVNMGTSDTPGSLECEFSNNVIGDIQKNTSNGIYGRYVQFEKNLKQYPVAACNEVKKGKAKMVCTVDDGGAKEYDVEITRINYNENNKQKNIVLRITDEELIAKTGGIVQGMSGSPIIQDQKLVGALTHVIVSNSKKGYAVFAQTMFEQSNY